MSAAKPTDSPVCCFISGNRSSCDASFQCRFQSLQVQVKSPTGTGAESPTTVRPLDMDDDDVQETGAISGDAPTSTSVHGTGAAEEAAPPKPPRPISEQQQNEITLREAFPTIDVAVVKAVLIASGGRVEPAFNALLGM
jgi:hypothetical protein